MGNRGEGKAEVIVKGRIAPTPSGYLHIGNAMNFVLAWLHVRHNNGTLRLRIDDLDTPRAKPEFLDDIFRTLEWLGLNWDEGPQTVAQHENEFSKHQRIALYETYLAKLLLQANVFGCTCSRKEISDTNQDGQYAGTCLPRNILLTQSDTAWRIFTPQEAVVDVCDLNGTSQQVNLYNAMRHFVIRRRDGIPAYQIASLADDLHYGINFVVRGEDLLPSTAAQLFLAEQLGETSFAQTQFLHHELLTDETGEKLSKSGGSTSLKHWRDAGLQREQFFWRLSEMMRLREVCTSAQEMLQLMKD